MPRTAGRLEPIDFKTRFPALDGIRALAVTMVFAFHYGGGTHGGRFLRLLNELRLQSWAGVDVFFVLSGFLITGILYDTLDDSRFFTRFFARRALRILPVAYLVALVLIFLTPVFHYQWKALHLTFLVYLGNIAGGFFPSLYEVQSSNPATKVYIGHLWSLCVEEQFYLLWPILVWTIRERVRLLWVAGGLSVLALLLRIWLVWESGINLRGGWLLDLLPLQMDTLLIGAMLALLVRGEQPERWLHGGRWLFAVGTGAIVLGFAINHGSSGRWMSTLGVTLIALASAGLIGWAICPRSIASGVLQLRPLKVLGKYSYGFYAYHLLFAAGWAALSEALTRRLHSAVLGSAISLTVNFTVTFLVAKLSYEQFELPFLRLKSRFSYDSECKPTVVP